jgi:hypothetical protein
MSDRTVPAPFAVLWATLLLAGLGQGKVVSAEEPTVPAQSTDKTESDRKWRPLFDGKTLEGWKASDFAGAGDVKVEDGSIVLSAGNDMTGITASREIPKLDYEVELEAQRLSGSDFFCALTFPVKDSFCSLVVGGWGGGVVGLSSLNGFDASENETTNYKKFENGKWYPVRLRVTDQRITAWIDGEEIVDVDTRETKLTTRIEVESSKPFGIASWQTKAALRKIRIRELTPEEVKAANAELENAQ